MVGQVVDVHGFWPGDAMITGRSRWFLHLESRDTMEQESSFRPAVGRQIAVVVS
jgi:hypothetical protein